MNFLQTLPYTSIIGALEYQALHRPEKTAILYPDRQCRAYASLNYRQYNNIVGHLAKKLHERIFSTSATCALLAVGGIDYLLAQYACLKLPHTIMFPISARNSPAAVEHLLRETKTSLLLTNSSYLPMIRSIQSLEEFQSLQVLLLDGDELCIDELLQNGKDVPCDDMFCSRSIDEQVPSEIDRIVVILHRLIDLTIDR
jgi:acyl-CoA synthetase (AMP-forming)/AMP-acid ligase II